LLQRLAPVDAQAALALVGVGADDLDAAPSGVLADLVGLVLGRVLLVLGRHPHVLTRHADRRDLDDPRVTVFPRQRRMLRDAVQAARQVAHVHLCKFDVSAQIPRPLLLAVALHVLGLGVAVVAPVVLVALRPRLLGGTLVDPVVGIGLELGPLPLSLAGALAIGRGTEGLVGDLRARFEGLAAAGAVSCHRRGLHANPHGSRDRSPSPDDHAGDQALMGAT
jgi:hypothetical protein